MKNRWSNRDAKAFCARYKSWGDDLALRTYTARLIGQDPALVLHGGGNTSVKTRMRHLTGESVEVLCVKGSGWDLDTIEPAGHPAVRLGSLLSLRRLDRLSDEDMVNQLRCNMLDSSGPNPSVEALLHAFLPHKFIDHTHADAVLSITNQPDGIKRALELGDGRMGVVPYIMPGFALAQLAAKTYEKNPRVEGLILHKHGIFTFGETTKQSYERMIYWVSRAEAHINRSRSRPLAVKVRTAVPSSTIARVANVLRGVGALSQDKPVIVRHRTSAAILDFINSPKAARLSQIGPATPDHVIRTKQKPLYLPPSDLTRLDALRTSATAAVERFKRQYNQYVKQQARRSRKTVVALDPMPRVVLVPGAGLFSLAADAKAADIALDIYERTIGVITNAFRIGRYEALSDDHMFDMEYWSLEQAKLGKATVRPFDRKVVWISGAASGIGLATARAFAGLGAHVFMTDRDEKTLKEAAFSLKRGKQIAFETCDVTKEAAVQQSFDECSRTFGGVDVVVSNAGFAPSASMKNCDDALLRRSFEVNFFGHQNVAKAATAVFERQRLGGSLLFNASKSTFNPGPDFGPYTLPKTAVIGLMKQYAVELGKIGVRSNAVNADRVHTGLFGAGLLEKRAKARGVTVSEYLSGNLLGQEVLASDVAQAFVHLALSAKTTGATLPVDGGNAAAFPR